LEFNKHHIIHVLNSKSLNKIVIAEDISYSDTFIREFKNESLEKTYVQYDLNFNLLNLEFKPKISFSSSKNKEFNKFLTLDIETFKDKDNKFIPYACGFYNGKKYLFNRF